MRRLIKVSCLMPAFFASLLAMASVTPGGVNILLAPTKALSEANQALRDGNGAEAIKLFRHAFSKGVASVESYGAHNNYCAALNLIRDHEAAIEECNRAVEIDRNRWEARNNLGIAYFNLGRYQEAVHTFKTALRYAPNDMLIRKNLRASENILKSQAEYETAAL